ncbi:hypothetical protein AVEN_253417-1, partial [Araneus ventricosus]
INFWGHSGLAIRSQFRDWRAPGSKPDSIEDSQYMCTLNHSQGANVLPLVWCGSFERGLTAQMSSSSSDHGSK